MYKLNSRAGHILSTYRVRNTHIPSNYIMHDFHHLKNWARFWYTDIFIVNVIPFSECIEFHWIQNTPNVDFHFNVKAHLTMLLLLLNNKATTVDCRRRRDWMLNAERWTLMCNFTIYNTVLSNCVLDKIMIKFLFSSFRILAFMFCPVLVRCWCLIR